MNCDQFKDSLLTDYVDRVLDPEKQKIADAHIGQCAECRRLIADLRTVTAETFGQVREIEPPAHVWAGIVERVQPSPGWFEKVCAVLTLPRLSIAIPVLASLMLFTFVQLRQPEVSYDITRAYLSRELGGDFGVLSNEDLENGSFGTVIEDFFM
ncbi:MAG: zf-HC2 domain-containing protein [Candidatus Omnitrophota bacterium]|nr:zf-HC2 domain-containing protein [Candidatus Omnitrophota bacterium]